MSSTESETQIGRLQAAAMVARVAELASIRLTQIEFVESVEPTDIAREECTLRTEAHASGYNYSHEASTLLVRILAGTSLTEAPHEFEQSESGNDGLEGGREIFRLKAVYELTYNLPSSAPPDDMQELLFGSFAASNGVYNAWPYFRELVHNISGRTGLPGILIPLYKVPKSEEEMEQAPPAPQLQRAGATR